MIFLLFLALGALCFILIKSADEVVVAVHRLSRNSTSFAFIISALFLAVATSLPELFVGISSGLGEVSSLSFGNVIGANIANLTFVAGLATLIVGSVKIHQEFIRREVLVAGAAGVLPFILAFVGRNLTRLDGLILIFTYFIYTLSFFKDKLGQIAEGFKSEHSFYKFFRKIKHIESSKGKEIARLTLGIFVLTVSAGLLVGVAQDLAVNLKIPVFLVGLVILSLGTTFPELALSIRSLKDKEPTMFFGNLLGSIVVNSVLITGVAVILSPIEEIVFQEYLIAFASFCFVYIVLWFFAKSQRAISRGEAAVLLFFYLVFVATELFWG